MIDAKITSRLVEKKYLSSLKNSTVHLMNKKNEFNDIVKFYTQIDENNNIYRIRYKASGCTYFIVYCSYFCELVEGKSVDEALAVTEESLSNYVGVNLEENRIHILSIILDTFKLLIKKYKKGVEKGKIKPYDVTAEIVRLENMKKLSKKIDVVDEESSIELEEDIEENEDEEDVLVDDIKELKEEILEDIITEEKNNNIETENINKEKSKSKIKTEKETILEKEDMVEKLPVDNAKKEEISKSQMSHILSLQEKINVNKENQNKLVQATHTNKLNSMLSNIHLEHLEKTKQLEQKSNKEKIQTTNRQSEEKKETKKKSLFARLFKK